MLFFCFFQITRRPQRSTLSSSSAASDVYKRQILTFGLCSTKSAAQATGESIPEEKKEKQTKEEMEAKYTKKFEEQMKQQDIADQQACLLYTSPSPRDRQKSRMPSSA
eukprot:TRINITY_DN5711_c0_g1_i2.p3 TRINITY_DN5711_c0_g1~~TRINITY_DN5711_c0_g1_i2.p3  ORF type:complete len:108 (+),score=26.39 TRINITY_DN5711_c0_g1_i2:41-364(+)